MEIQINKEIRNYTESVFFGLTLRQCVCSASAVIFSTACYISLRPVVGIEVTSWICIMVAAPLAALGFVKYHGMTAEQLLWAWLKSEVIEPRKLGYSANNLYYEATIQTILNHKREEKAHAEIAVSPHETEGSVHNPS